MVIIVKNKTCANLRIIILLWVSVFATSLQLACRFYSQYVPLVEPVVSLRPIIVAGCSGLSIDCTSGVGESQFSLLVEGIKAQAYAFLKPAHPVCTVEQQNQP